MTTCHLTRALVLLTMLGSATLVPAAPDPKPWHAGNARAVDAWTQAEQKQHAGNTNVWIARGILADRTTGRVEFVVEATGLSEGSIAEFMAVGEKSEKDYESLTVSFALASDICRAAEFVGMPRGRPVKPSICQFWPKGERMKAAIRPFGRDAKEGKPLQGCLRDKRPESIVPDNYVYVGSCWTGTTCLADEGVPGASISTYNEPAVVLDSPQRAPQGDVYGSLVVSPAGKFENGTLLTIELVPDPLSNGVPRVVDVALEAHRRAGAAGEGLGVVECVTRGAEPALGAATNDVKGALERLAALARAGRDPFVTVTLDDSLSVGTAGDLTRVLAMVEGTSGLRIEAPPPGQLYYKAFLPDERWRQRLDRPTQPWELRVARGTNGAWGCTLVQILEDWSKEGQLTPDLTPTDFPLARQEDLPGKVRALVDAQIADIKAQRTKADKPVTEDFIDQLASLRRINTIFVFAPPDAPLGAFMPAVRLVNGTLPQVHIFVEKPQQVEKGK